MEAEPSVAALNEPIKLIITVKERPEAVVLPELPDFGILAPIGPPRVYSEMQGQADDAIQIVISTYTALIVPTATGTFKIPGASVLNGKKLMQTNSVTIKVENRKVSWEDSTAIAQKFTGFRGNEKPYTPTKTAINYNKTNTSVGVGGSSGTNNIFGRGVDAVEIIPQSTNIEVAAGEEFRVVYDIYREAERAQFDTNIEILAPQEFEGLTILEGPNKRLHSQSNSFRKFTEGTVEYVLIAETSGEFQIPAITLRHNSSQAESLPVHIIIK